MRYDPDYWRRIHPEEMKMANSPSKRREKDPKEELKENLRKYNKQERQRTEMNKEYDRESSEHQDNGDTE